jgi:hypothetical protein
MLMRLKCLVSIQEREKQLLQDDLQDGFLYKNQQDHSSIELIA